MESRGASGAAKTMDPDELDLVELAGVVIKGWWAIGLFMAVFAIVGVVYALTAQEWFRSSVLMVLAERKQISGLGQLGGLASLAGISLDAGDASNAMIVLRSRDFTREFIEERNLMPTLYPKLWDDASGTWKSADPSQVPDIRDAIDMFDRQIRRVSEDRRTGEIRLSVGWTDPQVAANWANEMVRAVNDRLRRRALEESRQNIEFLRKQINATDIPALQQAISRALESELQKMMLAEIGEEYAFKVIDRAVPPRWRESPKRKIVVMLAGFLGAIVGVVFVISRSRWRHRKSQWA